MSEWNRIVTGLEYDEDDIELEDEINKWWRDNDYCPDEKDFKEED